MGTVTGIQAGQQVSATKTAEPLKKKESEETEVFEKQENKTESSNWFTRWLNDEDKGCTDGKDEGKISFGEKAKFFGKGLIGMVKGAINHPIATLGTMAAVTALTVATGGAAIPFLLGTGVVIGGAQIAYGAGKLANASTDAQAQEACEAMGNGFSSAILSLIGFKSFAKAKNSYITQTRSKASKLMKSKNPQTRKEASALLREDKNNLSACQKFNQAHPNVKQPKAAEASLKERLHNWFNKGKETTAQQKLQNNKNDNRYHVLNKETIENRKAMQAYIDAGKETVPTKPSAIKRLWIATKEKFYSNGAKLTEPSKTTPQMTVGEAKINLKNAQVAVEQAQKGLAQQKMFPQAATGAEGRLKTAQSTLKEAEKILSLAKKTQKERVTVYLNEKNANKPSFLERKISDVKLKRANLREQANIKAEANADHIQAYANALPEKPISTSLNIAKLGVKGQIQQAKHGVQDTLLAGNQKGLEITHDVVTFSGRTVTSAKNGVVQSSKWTSNKVTEGGKLIHNTFTKIPANKLSAITVPFGHADISSKPSLMNEELLEIAAK